MKYFAGISFLFVFMLIACQGDDSTTETDPTDDVMNAEFNIGTIIPQNITQIKATVGGEIEGVAVTDVSEKGVVYSLSANPTTNDHTILSDQNSLNFTVEITDLEVNTRYFVRAYAILNGEVKYGNEISFNTLEHKVFGGTILITSQSAIDSFFGEGWSKIGGIIIEEEIPGNITNLNALSSLIEIGSYEPFVETLYIANNQNLQNLNGLENVTNLGGIALANNNISDLSALSNLEVINGSVRISKEPLTSLQGLHNISEMPFTLQINETNLQNLNDLENLRSIGEDIIISNNASLVDLCALTPAINNGVVGFYTVFDNGYNPTIKDMENGDCSI